MPRSDMYISRLVACMPPNAFNIFSVRLLRLLVLPYRAIPEPQVVGRVIGTALTLSFIGSLHRGPVDYQFKDMKIKSFIFGLCCFMLAVPTAEAGAVGGPKQSHDRVNARSTDKYVVKFRGGSRARVTVNGDGDTDLDLYIYDETGNLIVSDTDDTDYCVCTWTPSWTGNFTIKIVNRGGVYNRYHLETN